MPKDPRDGKWIAYGQEKTLHLLSPDAIEIECETKTLREIWDSNIKGPEDIKFYDMFCLSVLGHIGDPCIFCGEKRPKESEPSNANRPS